MLSSALSYMFLSYLLSFPLFSSIQLNFPLSSPPQFCSLLLLNSPHIFSISHHNYPISPPFVSHCSPPLLSNISFLRAKTPSERMSLQSAVEDPYRFCCPDVVWDPVPPWWRKDRINQGSVEWQLGPLVVRETQALWMGRGVWGDHLLDIGWAGSI